eukprot:420221-Prymnesium_polylepis.1
MDRIFSPHLRPTRGCDRTISFETFSGGSLERRLLRPREAAAPQCPHRHRLRRLHRHRLRRLRRHQLRRPHRHRLRCLCPNRRRPRRARRRGPPSPASSPPSPSGWRGWPAARWPWKSDRESCAPSRQVASGHASTHRTRSPEPAFASPLLGPSSGRDGPRRGDANAGAPRARLWVYGAEELKERLRRRVVGGGTELGDESVGGAAALVGGGELLQPLGAGADKGRGGGALLHPLPVDSAQPAVRAHLRGARRAEPRLLLRVAEAVTQLVEVGVDRPVDAVEWELARRVVSHLLEDRELIARAKRRLAAAQRVEQHT